MVKYQEETLDRTFAALSDPTRRALLARLGSRESLSVSELAQPFAMSLPAIMKHLDVLSDAGLIAREKTGRTVACRLTAEPMEQAMDWLNRYRRFWSDALDRLAAFVEEDPWPPSQASSSQALPSQALPSTTPPAPPSPPPGRASRSRAGSARRPKKSTPRGPTRKS
jgi:DNA-binding transcriptional ArsR family regulator